MQIFQSNPCNTLISITIYKIVTLLFQSLFHLHLEKSSPWLPDAQFVTMDTWTLTWQQWCWHHLHWVPGTYCFVRKMRCFPVDHHFCHEITINRSILIRIENDRNIRDISPNFDSKPVTETWPQWGKSTGSTQALITKGLQIPLVRGHAPVRGSSLSNMDADQFQKGSQEMCKQKWTGIVLNS